jgi:hypothetical protein
LDVEVYQEGNSLVDGKALPAGLVATRAVADAYARWTDGGLTFPTSKAITVPVVAAGGVGIVSVLLSLAAAAQLARPAVFALMFLGLLALLSAFVHVWAVVVGRTHARLLQQPDVTPMLRLAALAAVGGTPLWLALCGVAIIALLQG